MVCPHRVLRVPGVFLSWRVTCAYVQASLQELHLAIFQGDTAKVRRVFFMHLSVRVSFACLAVGAVLCLERANQHGQR